MRLLFEKNKTAP